MSIISQSLCNPRANASAQANADNHPPGVTDVDGRPSTKPTVSDFLRDLADRLDGAQLPAGAVRLIWLPCAARPAELFVDVEAFRRLEACGGMPTAISPSADALHYRMGRLGLTFTACELRPVIR